MNSALTASMPLYARWQVPGCGLYFWVELPESMDASKLLNLCIEEEHVAFLPGEACSRGKRKNAMRLNFSQRDPCKIAQAIEKIAAVLKRNDANTSLSLDRK
jgi:DNA-binding transcriptional MocR family regulator